MHAMKILGIVTLAALGLYGLHRLCDWAESKGWIFYRKTRASGNPLGAAALQLQDIFESGKATHVLEAKESRPAKPTDMGPGPGKRPRA
jgi:hypothetical protein